MIVTVDIHETRHTCLASHEPHWFDRQSSVVSVVDGGPCRTPVTIRCGNNQAEIACRRHEPHERQCIACKSLLIVRNVTHTDLGWQGPDNRPDCTHRPPCVRIEVTA